MKKRNILLAFALLFSITSCATNTSEKTDKSETLTINKKYILSDDVNTDESTMIYLLFKENGKGIFRYYYDGSYFQSNYKIYFNYTIYNDAVICTYDYYELLDEKSTSPSHNWDNYYLYSKDFLITNETIYYCEDYIESNMKNFNK